MGGAVDRAQQRFDLAAVGGGLGGDARFQIDPFGDVGGELDDLVGLAVQVEYRVVGSLQPDHLAIVAVALIAAGIEFAAVELLPEFAVLGAGGVVVLAEDAVMLAQDVIEFVADRYQEVLVGAQDMAAHVELDDGLGFADGADLRFELGVAYFLGGNVAGKLDDLKRLAVSVEDRIVRRVQPDFAAALGDALVFARIVLTCRQRFPEVAVGIAGNHGGVTEHPMVLAADFALRDAHGREKIVVGYDNGAIEFEFDDSLRFADGVDLAFVFGLRALLGGDVGGELDHFVWLAIGVHDRVIGRVDPDFGTVLVASFVFATVELATGKLRPEQLVLARCDIVRLAENAVVAPLHLFKGVVEGAKEVVIGPDDGAVELKFNQRLHTVKRVVDRLQIESAIGRCVGEVIHVAAFETLRRRGKLRISARVRVGARARARIGH